MEEIVSESYSRRTRATPREMAKKGSIDRMRISKQINFTTVSPQRTDLLHSTALKHSKELREWIELDHPNGIELLERISRCQTPYKELIGKAVKEFRIVEKRANMRTERELAEKAQNADEVELEIDRLERKLEEMSIENDYFKKEIAKSHMYRKSIQNDINRLHNLMSNPLKRSSESSDSFFDDVTLSNEERIQRYIEEREKLENQLLQMESQLFSLTKQQISMLSGQRELSS